MAASCGVTFDELAGHAGDRRAMSVVCAIRARPELKLPEAATAAAVVAIVDLDCSDVECGAEVNPKPRVGLRCRVAYRSRANIPVNAVGRVKALAAAIGRRLGGADPRQEVEAAQRRG